MADMNGTRQRLKPIVASCSHCAWKASGSGVDPIATVKRLRALLIEHVERHHPETCQQGAAS